MTKSMSQLFYVLFREHIRLRVRVQVSLISLIGQANNGVACLSHVESGAPRMRIDIQKAEHVTSTQSTMRLVYMYKKVGLHTV